MIQFQDIAIIAALFNFFSMIGNLFWSFKLNSVKGSNELISYWKGKCEEQEDEIVRLKAKLAIYQKYHGHKPLA